MVEKRGLIVLGIIILFILSIFFLLILNKKNVCNDGTPSGQCSKIQPYFCSDKTLIEKVSVCGCSEVLTIDGNKCTSRYQTEPKIISLYYTLRGKKEQINFTVYKGIYDYISEISRYVDSNENATLLYFKQTYINEKQQREFLLPLAIQIINLTSNKEDQARIAISLIQNVPFGASNKTVRIGNVYTPYQRYPYEVLYDKEGICSEKSALLIFLLREIGYGTAFVYYDLENHEVVGIKCPKEEGIRDSGYCFVETTGPSIISDDKSEYIGVIRLKSIPQIINISEGDSLKKNLYEYIDATRLAKIRDTIREYGVINPLQSIQFKIIQKRYGLINFDEYVF